MKRVTLNNTSRNIPYKVPEQYFENLQARIQTRIETTPIEIQEAEVLSISWSWRRTVMVGMAASIIGILFWITYPAKQTSVGEGALSQVSNESIMNYIENNAIDTKGLVETETKSLSNAVSDSLLIQELEISDDDIVNELIDNQIIKEII
jgi:hexokinase